MQNKKGEWKSILDHKFGKEDNWFIKKKHSFGNVKWLTWNLFLPFLFLQTSANCLNMFINWKGTAHLNGVIILTVIILWSVCAKKTPLFNDMFFVRSVLSAPPPHTRCLNSPLRLPFFPFSPPCSMAHPSQIKNKAAKRHTQHQRRAINRHSPDTS